MPMKSLADHLENLAQLQLPELGAGPTTPSPTAKVRSPRSRNRGGAWSHALTQQYAYYAARATTDQQRADLDQAYQAALEEGPDFTQYRTGSSFMQAPKLSIDRNQVARIMFALHAIARGTWRSRDPRKQGLSRATAQVLYELLRLALKYGRVYPSLDALAQRAMVCKQTLVSCLKTLQLYGFITVHRRIKRIRTALGFKTVQETNAYEVHEPRGLGAIALNLFLRFSESKNRPASSSISYSKKAQAPSLPAWGIPDGVFDPPYRPCEGS